MGLHVCGPGLFGSRDAGKSTVILTLNEQSSPLYLVQDEMEVWVCLVCGPMVFQCGRVLVDLRFRSFDGKHRALKSPFTVSHFRI